MTEPFTFASDRRVPVERIFTSSIDILIDRERIIMSRGSGYIERLAKSELTDIPDRVDVPRYCLKSVKRAQAFAAGYQRASQSESIASEEDIIDTYGKMGYRAYVMGFDAAITLMNNQPHSTSF
jgi:hypothetical protein